MTHTTRKVKTAASPQRAVTRQVLLEGFSPTADIKDFSDVFSDLLRGGAVSRHSSAQVISRVALLRKMFAKLRTSEAQTIKELAATAGLEDYQVKELVWGVSMPTSYLSIFRQMQRAIAQDTELNGWLDELMATRDISRQELDRFIEFSQKN